MAHYIAIDLGGGSGRVIAGRRDTTGIATEEVYRFPNRTIMHDEQLCWDHRYIFEQLTEGLKRAARRYDDIVSIGIDSWGVDFALVDHDGNLIGETVCYRDRRTEGIEEELFAHIDRSKHYGRVGIRQMAINTLFQLYALKRRNPDALTHASRILFTPDYYAFRLCGEMANEYTIASTSELIDANTCKWDMELIDVIGLPRRLFGDTVRSGTTLGSITAQMAEVTGLSQDVKVVAVASHDTASAIASLGDIGENAAFLSSGTWSLLGVILERPILSQAAFEAGFSNEGGHDGKICFLQNITGLWILQSLMRQWNRTDVEVLSAEAAKSQMTCTIDVDSPSLVNPTNMEQAVGRLCSDNPMWQYDYVNIVLRSLAHRYGQGLDELERITGRRIDTVHIIGGGSRNSFLNTLTERITGRRVVLGNPESTAMGNLLIQVAADRSF